MHSATKKEVARAQAGIIDDCCSVDSSRCFSRARPRGAEREELAHSRRVGTWPGAGDHHAPLSIFPDLFAQEGLDYGTSEAPFVWCTNATDKGLLAPGGQGTVLAAGHCKSDKYIVHILRGIDAPDGWSTVGDGFHYMLTPLG